MSLLRDDSARVGARLQSKSIEEHLIHVESRFIVNRSSELLLSLTVEVDRGEAGQGVEASTSSSTSTICPRVDGQSSVAECTGTVGVDLWRSMASKTRLPGKVALLSVPKLSCMLLCPMSACCCR